MQKSLKLFLIILLFLTGGCKQKPPSTIDKGKITFLRFQSAALSKDDKTEIYTIKPDGKEEERITQNSRMELFPEWIDGGREIIFAVDELGTKIINDKEEIKIINVKNKKEESISINSGAPRVSNDGKKIAFIRDGNIWIMNIDGRKQKRITKFPKNCQLSPVSWSSDNQTLFFACNQDKVSKKKTGFDIFRIGINGKAMRRLTKEKADEIDPAISPNGKDVIFSRKKEKKYELVKMKPGGSEQKVFLPSTKGGIQANWSPDNKMIAFVRDDSIHLVSIDKRYKKRLTSGIYPNWIF